MGRDGTVWSDPVDVRWDRIGADAFPGVRGNVYKSFWMLLHVKERIKTEYAVIRWYNDCEALVLFTGWEPFLYTGNCRLELTVARAGAGKDFPALSQ